jgi:hypothetical protein
VRPEYGRQIIVPLSITNFNMLTHNLVLLIPHRGAPIAVILQIRAKIPTAIGG